MPDIIHILNEAKFPLCGYISTPSDTTWPMGHRWTLEKENATCARCRRAAGLKVTTEHWLDGIKEIYAVIGGDAGGEGIVAAMIQGRQTPLFAADESRLESIIPIAQDIATQHGDTFQIVKFTTREFVMEIKP